MMNFSHLFDASVIYIISTNFVGSAISSIFVAISFFIFTKNNILFRNFLGISFIGSFIGGTIGFLLGASSGSVGAVIAGLFGVVSVIAAYLFGKDRSSDAIILICSIFAFFLSMLTMTAAGNNAKAASERAQYCREILLEHFDDSGRIDLFRIYCKKTWLPGN